MNRVEEIRALLTEYVEYNLGVSLRIELNLIANNEYVQKYTDSQHIEFCSRHELTINRVHPQSRNYPHYLVMFTEITQHIYADTVRQLFDIAIDIEQNKNK